MAKTISQSPRPGRLSPADLALSTQHTALRTRLGSLVEEFLRDLNTRGRSPATMSAYSSDLQALIKGLGVLESKSLPVRRARRGRQTPRLTDSQTLDDFDLANVKTYLQSYAAGHKPRSVARRLSCYRQFSRFLCERGYLERDPLEFLRPPPWHNRQEREASDTTGLDKREVNQLLQECDRDTALGRRDYAMLMLMLGTGARVSDAVNLDLDAVEITPKRCRVVFRNRKGGRFSAYNLVGPYREALEDYLAHRSRWSVASGQWSEAQAQSPKPRAQSPEAVFLSRLGRRMTRQTVFARVKELVRTSRIRSERKAQIHPHSLRHTYVSRLWEQEKDVVLVAQAAGHASPTVTLNVYTHIARERTEAAIARMQEQNP